MKWFYVVACFLFSSSAFAKSIVCEVTNLSGIKEVKVAETSGAFEMAEIQFRTSETEVGTGPQISITAVIDSKNGQTKFTAAIWDMREDSSLCAQTYLESFETLHTEISSYCNGKLDYRKLTCFAKN